MAHDNYLVLLTFGAVKHDAGFRLCEKVSLIGNGENPALAYFLTYAKNISPSSGSIGFSMNTTSLGTQVKYGVTVCILYSVDLILIG